MTAEMELAKSRDAWRQQILFLLLCLSIIVWFFDSTYSHMVSIWWNASTFNHCFLIPLISLYLVWEKRQTIQYMQPSGSYLGMVFVFLSSLVWLAGELVSVSVLQHLAIVSLLIGVVWSLVGNQVASYLMFPLAYLYFAVPEGEFMVPYLMDWTAWISVKLLRLTGIPVFLEARYITIPTGNFVVAEACSGINYLIASLSLSTVFAYLNYRSWNRRLFFMLLALIVPLVANGVRAYGIVMIAHLSDMKYATGVDHIIYGWFFFGIVIFILFYLGGLFSEHESEPDPNTLVKHSAGLNVMSPMRLARFSLMTLILAVSGQGLLVLMDASRQVPASLELPQLNAEWSGPEKTQAQLGGNYVGVKQHISVVYRSENQPVHLEIAYYDREENGQELISSLNQVYSEEQWKRIEETVNYNETLGTNIKQYVLRKGSQDYLVYFWYDLHGQVTVSGIKAKLYQAKARAGGSDLGAAAFSAYIELGIDRKLAEQKLQTFIKLVKPGLLTMGQGAVSQ